MTGPMGCGGDPPASSRFGLHVPSPRARGIGVRAMSPASSTQRPVTEPFVHPALFYRGTRGYLAGTMPFIRAGLKLGEPVAVAVPGQNLRLLRSELGESAALVRWVDMTKAGRNPGWIIPGVLRGVADAHSPGRVRIIGEPIWPGRSENEYPACVQHEALINLAFAGRAVTILCPYDAGSLRPRVRSGAAAARPRRGGGGGGRRGGGGAPGRGRRAGGRARAGPTGR